MVIDHTQAGRAVAGRLRGLRAHAVSDDSDLLRMQRSGARFIGLGLLTFTVVTIPVAIRCADLTADWWTPVSMVLIVGPAILLVLASLRPVPRGHVGLMYLSALGYVLATLLWFVAWNGTTNDPAHWAVWMVQFPSVASIGLVLVSRTRWAIAHLVTATLAVHAANQVGRFGEIRPVALLSAPLTMALSGVFLAVAIATMANVRLLDARRAEILASAATGAAEMAQEAERARFAAVIHDRVIASLLAVTPGRPDPRLASQAASTLDELDRSDDNHLGDVSAAQVAERIRATAASVSDDVRSELFVHDRSVFYPADVVSALTASMGEAVRNWHRHAGGAARCVVGGDFACDAVRVTITDDGVGFDPGSVAPERYGIATGIRGRMASLPGGMAQIISAPRRGTTVVVQWRRP
ncbi:sensor histidine kinase [Gordonia sp. SL306]|uniref:sensor histidine kinase n=1 Tax=Gordonia sp. SL306 TaxID=2995145 RepID=UPI00226D8CE8|nr:ATP-binding protein [Gordonia sp. SL306]WAC56504.1 ATP-binding protein [Gordonia sp. SL306]